MIALLDESPQPAGGIDASFARSILGSAYVTGGSGAGGGSHGRGLSGGGNQGAGGRGRCEGGRARSRIGMDPAGRQMRQTVLNFGFSN